MQRPEIRIEIQSRANPKALTSLCHVCRCAGSAMAHAGVGITGPVAQDTAHTMQMLVNYGVIEARYNLFRFHPLDFLRSNTEWFATHNA